MNLSELRKFYAAAHQGGIEPQRCALFVRRAYNDTNELCDKVEALEREVEALRMVGEKAEREVAETKSQNEALLAALRDADRARLSYTGPDEIMADEIDRLSHYERVVANALGRGEP